MKIHRNNAADYDDDLCLCQFCTRRKNLRLRQVAVYRTAELVFGSGLVNGLKMADGQCGYSLFGNIWFNTHYLGYCFKRK